MKRIKKRRAFELCWNERRALAVVDMWLLQWEEEKRGGPRKRVEMVAEKASSACTVS